MQLSKENLAGICQKYEKVYIYGAGSYASLVFRFLNGHGVQASGFLVSDPGDNPNELFGLPIISIDNFTDCLEYLIIVAVSSTSKAYREILDCLIEKGITNVLSLSKAILSALKKEALIQGARDAFCAGGYYMEENAPAEINHVILAMKGLHGESYHWRVALRKNFPENISKIFEKKSALEEFEEAYGKYNVFHERQINSMWDSTCAVYMARSHVDKELERRITPSWLTPIQVGAALTDMDICAVKDNTGENISERNSIYSECTALYWMWKNAPKTGYIGLCHYRRHFDLMEYEISKLSNFDVLVTSPSFVNETNGTFFSTLIPKSDLRVMLESIGKCCPDYLPAARKFLESRFYPPCNLFIMRYDLFQEYGAFLFSVTFEVERFFKNLGFCRQDRYMGYLAECLMGIFLMKNKEQLKIGYTDMRFVC